MSLLLIASTQLNILITQKKKALNDVISLACTIALDPQVSEDAAELVKKAKREALLEAADFLFRDGQHNHWAVKELHRMAGNTNDRF